mmetsp:Transcript_55983/g.181497  ORF Transcript_55983/g.181497 Transcript_55983/m.181497 type:complete len:206 (+) Transcript_55983:267-884(+)
MSISVNFHHFLVVRMEDVCIDPEEPLVDHFHALLEGRREGHTGLYWNEGLVGQLLLHPLQQSLEVLRCRQLHGDLGSLVSPLEGIEARVHLRARGVCAQILHSPSEQVYLVEHVHCGQSYPLLLGRSSWTFHLLPQLQATQRVVSLLDQGAIPAVGRHLHRRQQSPHSPVIAWHLHSPRIRNEGAQPRLKSWRRTAARSPRLWRT